MSFMYRREGWTGPSGYEAEGFSKPCTDAGSKVKTNLEYLEKSLPNKLIIPKMWMKLFINIQIYFY